MKFHIYYLLRVKYNLTFTSFLWFHVDCKWRVFHGKWGVSQKSKCPKFRSDFFPIFNKKKKSIHILCSYNTNGFLFENISHSVSIYSLDTTWLFDTLFHVTWNENLRNMVTKNNSWHGRTDARIKSVISLFFLCHSTGVVVQIVCANLKCNINLKLN